MQVSIERLGHLGDGIAPGPVYAPRTLPGEIVEGAIEDQRIEAPRIIAPSPDRVRPQCRHYRSCGGCALQHASDGFVTRWKTEVVRAALAAQGLGAVPDAILTSPPRSRRRAVFAGRRTKGGPLVGFHAPRSDAITRIPDCQLIHPLLISALPALEALVEAGGSRRTALRLSVTVSQDGPDVAVSSGKPLDQALSVDLARIAGQFGIARLAWDGELVALVSPPAQTFGRAAVVSPPGAFLQATAEGETALVSEVRRATRGANNVLDLFAGCGTFSLPLAEDAEVHAVEGNEAMLSALDAGWRGATGLKRVTTEARDLFRRPMLPDELDRFDAVVIDPPRAGAESQVAELARSGISIIAAVSCNPVSFARDARLLMNAGYEIQRLVIVDQFRWSTHVELFAGFRRK